MYGDYRYNLSVVDPRSGDNITSGCLVFVYTAGTKNLATIYGSDKRGTLANPITRAQFAIDDEVFFYAATPTVDIFIADDLGNTSFLPSVAYTEHKITLPRDGVSKCLVAPFTFAVLTEVDTGLDFPNNVWVHDCMVEVVTADSGITLDVGLLSSETAGDIDGFLKAVSLTSTGFIRPYVTVDSTTEDYISTPYKGALFGVGSAGTTAANDFGQPGGVGHIVTGSNAKSLVYDMSAGGDTGEGYIYAFFRHLR